MANASRVSFYATDKETPTRGRDVRQMGRSAPPSSRITNEEIFRAIEKLSERIAEVVDEQRAVREKLENISADVEQVGVALGEMQDRHERQDNEQPKQRRPPVPRLVKKNVRRIYNSLEVEDQWKLEEKLSSRQNQKTTKMVIAQVKDGMECNQEDVERSAQKYFEHLKRMNSAAADLDKVTAEEVKRKRYSRRSRLFKNRNKVVKMQGTEEDKQIWQDVVVDLMSAEESEDNELIVRKTPEFRCQRLSTLCLKLDVEISKKGGVKKARRNETVSILPSDKIPMKFIRGNCGCCRVLQEQESHSEAEEQRSNTDSDSDDTDEYVVPAPKRKTTASNDRAGKKARH